MPPGNAPTVPEVDWQLTAVGGLDLAAIIILTVGAVGAAIWTWRSLDPAKSMRLRVLITALRSCVLCAALGLLLQPTLRIRHMRHTPARIAALVDVSGSMQLGSPSRLAGIEKLIERGHGELADFASRNEIIWYRFASGLERVESLERALEPGKDTARTDILGALIELGRDNESGSLDAVVVLSDGADTSLDKANEEAFDVGAAQRLGAPVNTVAVTHARELKDLAIESVSYDNFAFSRSETPLVVTLRSTGLPDREVEAFLWQEGSIVRQEKLRLVGGRGRLSFTIFPSSLGRHVMTVTVPPPPEDQVPENNTAHVSFEVIRDKFRVLHLAGKPSWDQRFLRQTLSSWPRIDLVSFYVLRTPYQSSIQGSAGMSLIPFPTEDLFEGHLEEFDVVIFQDFDPTTVNVDQYLDRIAKFVKEGGALVLMGGQSSFDRRSFPSAELAALFPVELLSEEESGPKLVDGTPFRPNLTDSGKRHPLTRIEDDPEKNAQTWRSLARLDGWTRVIRLTPGAVSLAEHPFDRADDGPAPIIAVSNAGAGRSLAIATDSTWRWAFTGPMNGGPPEAHLRFWKQAMSWLTRDPELDRLRLQVRPSPVVNKDTATIDVELLDDSYGPIAGAPISSRISWIDKDGTEQTELFEGRLDDQGKYRRTWRPKHEGPHNISVDAQNGRMSKTKRFLVLSRDREAGYLTPVESTLRRIADATGGLYQLNALSWKKLERRGGETGEILSRRDIHLWNNPLAFLFVFGLLAADWLLRRRIGVL